VCSVLIVILSANFVDFFKVILLLFRSALGELGRLCRRDIIFFLFFLIELLFFIIYVLFDGGGFGVFAVGCRLGDRLRRRSLGYRSRLGLAFLCGRRSFYILSVHTQYRECTIDVKREINRGWK